MIVVALVTQPWTAGAIEETWISRTNAPWSLDTAWLDGSAPPVGGSADLSLRFSNDGTNAFNATNDRGPNFVLNQLHLRNDSIGAITISSASGSSLQLAGNGAQIEFEGRGTSQITSDLYLNASDKVTQITGAGLGTLQISGIIREQSAGQILEIDVPTRSVDTHRVVLSATNSFSGGVVLKSGNLQLQTSTAPLGTGPVTISGGTLNALNASLTVIANNAFLLNTDLRISEGGFLVLGGVISSSVPGTGLIYRNGGTSFPTLTLTNVSTYDGPTILDYSTVAGSAPYANSLLQLSGNGSILNTSAIHVRSGGTLRLDATSGANNRIADTTPVHLRSGELLMIAPTAAAGPQTEIIGPLDIAGQSIVTVQPDSDAGVVLTGSSLTRIERGTLLLRGAGLGSASAVNVGNLFFTTSPQLSGAGGTGPQRSILPYAVGGNTNSDTGTSLVTYDSATGIRPLDTTTEYAASLASAGSTDNVRLTASETTDVSRVVNALVASVSNGSLNGAGTLTISSGAFLNTAPFSVANQLAFGSSEAVIVTNASLSLNGAVTGTNGLTKSGTGTLTLSAGNTITGPLTLNAGRLVFSSLANLGPGTSTIALHGGKASAPPTSLSYSGATDITLTRPIETATGMPGVETSGTGRLLISGVISGAGGLVVNGRITLGPNNTYIGPTLIGGDAVIAADSSLGIGGGVHLAGGTVTLAGDWISNRSVSLNQATTLDTGDFLAQIDGVLSGAGSIRKRGTGTLRLTSETLASGAITIDAGVVELRQGASILSNTLTANTGSELRLDNSAASNSNRIPDGATLSLFGGSLGLIGNNTAVTDERISTLATTEGPGAVVKITAPGSVRTVLTIGTLTTNRGSVLFRSDQLGDQARVILTSPPSVVGGIARALFVSPASSETPRTFAVYDTSISGGAPVGLRGLKASEITATALIQNPESGGTTPSDAHVEITTPATSIGSSNRIASLMLGANGSLSLADTQLLHITSGSLLVREDANAPAFTGGTLEFGSQPGVIYLGADTTISSAILAGLEVRKIGLGTLRLAGPVVTNSGFRISEGVVVPIGSPLSASSLAINTGGTFDLQSTSSRIGSLIGSGAVNLGSGTLTVGTLSTSSSSFSGSISGTGSLEIVSTGSLPAVHSFTGTSTFSGGTVLQSGRLHSGTSGSLGTGPLTINGGSLFASTASTFAVPLRLNADLVTEGSVALTFAPAAATSGAFGVEVRGRGGIVVSAPWSHTGPTQAGSLVAGATSGLPGSITLSGMTGALLSTSAIRMAAGSSLVLDNAIAYSGIGNGRIGDATPVALRRASIELRGNATLGTLEQLGLLDTAGESSITVTPGTSAGATLRFASLQRDELSTVLFRAPGLGSATSGAVGKIMFDSSLPGLIGGADTGPATRILPYAIGDISTVGTGSGLVTYNAATGVRILDPATDYSASLSSATANDNVRLTANDANSVTKAINSLVLDGAVNVSGSGMLQLASSVILKTGSATPDSVISNSITFGSTTGHIYVSGDSGGLTLNGVISGDAGVLKAGPRALTLNAVNSFKGPLVINNGDVVFSSATSLGAPDAGIIFNDAVGGAGISYSGTSPLTLTRNLEIRDGVGFLRSQVAGADITLQGTISGPGGFGVSGPATAVLTGANTYTGPTIVQGTLSFPTDAALGNGGRLEFGGTAPRIRLDGPWTTSRDITIASSSASVLDTNGYDATWSGTLLNTSGTLTKRGLGTLTQTSDVNYAGFISAAEGLVLLNGDGATNGSFTASSNGIVRFDNTATPRDDRIGDTLMPGSGRIELLGHPAIPIREDILSISHSSGAHGTLMLSAPGTAPMILESESYSVPQPRSDSLLTFTGNNLGGGPDGGFTRVTLRSAPALQSGLLSRAIVDSGGVENLATYDSTVDSAGAIGVRAFRPAEYFSGTLVRNPANGGTTPVDANFLVNGAVAAFGPASTLNSLTFASGGSLSFTPTQSLVLTSGLIFTPRGVADASSVGGDFAFPGKVGVFAGDGDLKFGSRISTVGTDLIKFGTGALSLTGDSPLNALNFVIAEGRLRPGSGVPLGRITVSVNSGAAIEVAGGVARIGGVFGAGTLMLSEGELQVGGFTSFTGPIVGPGTLTVTGGQLAYAGAAAHTGPTKLVQGASMTLSAGGTMLTTRELRVSNSTLTLNNAASALSRIGAVPVSLNGGTLTLHGNPNNTLTENAGTLSLGGHSTLRVEADTATGASGTSARLAFSDVSRTDHGTFGVQLAPAAAPASRPTYLHLGGVQKDLVGVGSTAFNRPILPYALSTITSPPVFVTHEATAGIRALDPLTEFSAALTAGDNVRLDSGGTLNSNLTINSLQIKGDLTGAGKLSVASGALLSFGGNIDVPLDFGNTEAIIYCWNDSILYNIANTVTLRGSISGTAGLTLSGVPGGSLNDFRLAGENTFTGPLTFNRSRIQFSNLQNLGADNSPISLSAATLLYTGFTDFTLSRAIHLTGGISQIGGNVPKVTVSGLISGEGGLQLTGKVTLPGANTYEGGTSIMGNISFNSDAAFGSGGITLYGVGGTNGTVLRPQAPWTTTRSIFFGGFSEVALDAGPSDVVWNGPISSDLSYPGPFIKLGTGKLTLNGSSKFGSALRVDAGSLVVNGLLQPDSLNGSVSVSVGGTLAGSGNIQRSLSISGTLNPGDPLGALTTGNVSFTDGSTLALTLDSKTSFDRLNVTGTVTLGGKVNLMLQLGYDPVDGIDTFTLIDNDGTEAIGAGGSATFAFGGSPVDEGALLTVGAQVFRFSYKGGDGNDVTIFAVPEPGTGALSVGGLLVFFSRKRRAMRVVKAHGSIPGAGGESVAIRADG